MIAQGSARLSMVGDVFPHMPPPVFSYNFRTFSAPGLLSNSDKRRMPMIKLKKGRNP
jgi:hypothetical protein